MTECPTCSEPIPMGGSCHGNVYKPDAVNRPVHYGGAFNPYEAIKVINAWSLGFRQYRHLLDATNSLVL